MTTHAEARGLVLSMVECFNSREFDDADALYSSRFLTHPFGTGAAEGKRAWQLLADKYPDITLTVDDVLVDDDRVTACSTITGVGTPPGDPDPVLIEVFRVESGRFVEWWGSTWLPDLS